jgi:hypothetical protein
MRQFPDIELFPQEQELFSLAAIFFRDFYDRRLAAIVGGALRRGRILPTGSFPRAHEM